MAARGEQASPGARGLRNRDLMPLVSRPVLGSGGRRRPRDAARQRTRREPSRRGRRRGADAGPGRTPAHAAPSAPRRAAVHVGRQGLDVLPHLGLHAGARPRARHCPLPDDGLQQEPAGWGGGGGGPGALEGVRGRCRSRRLGGRRGRGRRGWRSKGCRPLPPHPTSFLELSSIRIKSQTNMAVRRPRVWAQSLCPGRALQHAAQRGKGRGPRLPPAASCSTPPSPHTRSTGGHSTSSRSSRTSRSCGKRAACARRWVPAPRAARRAQGSRAATRPARAADAQPTHRRARATPCAPRRSTRSARSAATRAWSSTRCSCAPRTRGRPCSTSAPTASTSTHKTTSQPATARHARPPPARAVRRRRPATQCPAPMSRSNGLWDGAGAGAGVGAGPGRRGAVRRAARSCPRCRRLNRVRAPDPRGPRARRH
jgi:hypothetical protein